MNQKDKTYRRRLLKLAAFLDKLPRKRFAFDSWVGSDWKGKKDLSCGTTACALGWSTTIPEFRKLGLNLATEVYDYGDEKEIFGYVRLGNSRLGADGAPEAAAKKVFGVNEEEFSFLFVPNSIISDDKVDYVNPDDNATPKQVANNIRKFVEYKYGKEAR